MRIVIGANSVAVVHYSFMMEQILAVLEHRGIDRIDALIVLGSGMSGCFLPDEYDVVFESEAAGVHGHPGRLALLRGAGARVLVSLGRRHLYEGYGYPGIVETVRLAARLGARTAVLTNAVGGLNPLLRPGDLMLIESSLTTMLGRYGVDPGHAADHHGDVHLHEMYLRNRPEPPFATMLYDRIANDALAYGLRLMCGTYAAVPGPSYETRAEIRMLRRMGADAVGMSTALEAREAWRLGMNVIGVSLITNMLCDTECTLLDHMEVLEQGRTGERRMRLLLDGLIRTMFSPASVAGLRMK